MKTILITAYAVNPFKGSEEGTGWNLISEVAKPNRVIAITRKNNRADIEKFLETPAGRYANFSNIQFLYFDLPRWMIVWKKGPLLSALYFYIWQFWVAVWVKSKNLSFDIAHSLNFHSNWTPSFLWILGKPFAWGPVGNHPLIPFQYIRGFGFSAVVKDRLLWLVKLCFWNLDPFLWICRYKAKKVFCVNTQASAKLRLSPDKVIYMPAVASECPDLGEKDEKEGFTVLSVGRFVPLKGFDLTIKSFAAFYRSLSVESRKTTRLLLIGSGPEKKKLQQLVKEEGISGSVQIKEWMPREDVIKRFKHSAVFLFPSHEGAGMVVAEALSYGLPVVCLDNYGPGEYVHPSTALKVAHAAYEQTITALAEKLSLLHADQAFYLHESNLSRQRYLQMFQWNIKGDCMQQAYNAISLPAATATLNSLSPYVS